MRLSPVSMVEGDNVPSPPLLPSTLDQKVGQEACYKGVSKAAVK